VKFTHINRVIHHYRGAEDTTRRDDTEGDDRGAEDTTRRDDTEGDDRGADDASRWGLMDVVRDVASNGRTFVDEARVYLNQ
jgi:hypothetical protein